ncbi:MAG: acylphosphatase [Actinomycetota bacterium]|nr:acylphosphatase [Actinomycetota bacterium]
MIRRRVVVSGEVQGVFFRDSCRDVALQHEVAGSAANRSDGRLEVILEGEQEAVDAVIKWCRSGPPHADVTGVDVSEEEPEGMQGFTTS